MPLKLTDITARPNGARFYTADLHIHTRGGSVDVQDAAMTPQAVIDAAITAGIGIIAITDHNSDRNTASSIEYAQKHAGQLLVLAATEITSAHGHVLAYFDPLNASALRTFLGRLNVIKPGSPESHTQASMADVIAEAERLGGICVAAHIDRKLGFESMQSGYPNWKKDILLAAGLRALEVADAANLSWYSEDDEPTSDGGNRKNLLTARGENPATASRKLLAHVQNSDSHTLAEFAAAIPKRSLTRYKMTELSFEGFRTAMADPSARVRAVATLPSAIPRVIGMAVNGGFLSDERFHLNSNLNCFIGGRGAGKSTALRCLAYGLGVSNEMEERDDCPDSVVIYCEDANGVLYRYERTKAGLKVQAKEDNAIEEVPVDSFSIELYSQGELAEVGKDPLGHAAHLQEFLDRHIHLSDLTEREKELLEGARQNGAQLTPQEAKAALRPAKAGQLVEVGKKLLVAELGKLKELAAQQTRLSAERSLRKSLDDVRKMYVAGVSLNVAVRNYTALAHTAGELTGDAKTAAHFSSAKTVIEQTNAELKRTETDINAVLKTAAIKLEQESQGLSHQHTVISQTLEVGLDELRGKGLSGSIVELQQLLTRRSELVEELNRIDMERPILEKLRNDRRQFLLDLAQVRQDIVDRRKAQLAAINKNLARAIEDYTVVVMYDPAGVIDQFKTLLSKVMQGAYFSDELATSVCTKVTPAELAELIAAGKHEEIALRTGLEEKWVSIVVQRFGILVELHKLQVTWKPPRPTILVRTKGGAPKQIPVKQLSDGQKHTILLTIAMLAESSVPLIIDQPEDDLDNAFIFSSVVQTLRAIKERRQVLLVTHNANIAVLGDAELIFPMKRSADRGESFDAGSIDKLETRKAAERILEGGELAFLKRKEIYGH